MSFLWEFLKVYFPVSVFLVIFFVLVGYFAEDRGQEKVAQLKPTCHMVIWIVIALILIIGMATRFAGF